jgi:cysteine desulfurase family protein (TIGR01976 family)
VPQRVADAAQDYLLHHNANTHWHYPTSNETDAMIANSRQVLAEFFNCDDSEVVFGYNMTTLTFHLARALSWQWQPGDEVVVTELDHQANVAPWTVLQRERGITVRVAPFDPATGELEMARLAQLITPRTKLVAVGAASNAIGTVNDLEEIIIMARGVDALVYVDAVHAAPHILPDVRELDCDFMATSAYKYYGPHIGVLYARGSLTAELEVPRLDPAPPEMPERLETGTGNHEGMIGAAAAIEFLASHGAGKSLREQLRNSFAETHARCQLLMEQMWSGLAAVRGVTLYGPAPDRPRTPTIAFNLAGVHPDDVTRHLAQRGVFVSHGDFYASTVIDRLGVAPAGVVRAGAACYTSSEEVERLVHGVAELAVKR